MLLFLPDIHAHIHTYCLSFQAFTVAVVHAIDFWVIKQCRKTYLFRFSEKRVASIFRVTELRSNGCRIGLRKSACYVGSQPYPQQTVVIVPRPLNFH